MILVDSGCRQGERRGTRVWVCRARGEGGAIGQARRKGWASGCKISLPRYTAGLRTDGVHDGSSSREGARGLRLNG
jgi:hypothetical protein